MRVQWPLAFIFGETYLDAMFNREMFAADVVAAVRARRSTCSRWERVGVRRWAAECGVSPATFSRMARGRVPDVETFLAVCAWMGTPPDRYYVLPVGTQLAIK